MEPAPTNSKFIYVALLMLLLVVVAAGIGFMIAGQWTRSTQPAESGENSASPQSSSAVTASSQGVSSASPSSASPTATADVAQSVTLTKVSETKIDGGNLWLFPVPDGEAKVALSTEQGGTIKMGRLDIENPSQEISWKQVASSADTGGQQIADHWHIYAHDAHWITFSVQQANRSFLMKLDKDYNRLLLADVANNDQLSDDEQLALGLPTGQKSGQGQSIPTNDMYLVAEPNGVAVSHMVPGVGSRIYRFDRDGNLLEKTIVGGDDYQHNNGSSAVQTAAGYTIYGSESLNVVAQGAIKEIKTDPDWKPLSVTLLVDEDRVNAAMPTAVEIANHRILTFRGVDGAYGRGTMPPPAQPGQPLADDSGAIVRYLLDNTGRRVHREVLVNDEGNRPRTAVVGNYLLTAWDQDTTIRLRVDRFE